MSFVIHKVSSESAEQIIMSRKVAMYLICAIWKTQGHDLAPKYLGRDKLRNLIEHVGKSFPNANLDGPLSSLSKLTYLPELLTALCHALAVYLKTEPMDWDAPAPPGGVPKRQITPMDLDLNVFAEEAALNLTLAPEDQIQSNEDWMSEINRYTEFIYYEWLTYLALSPEGDYARYKNIVWDLTIKAFALCNSKLVSNCTILSDLKAQLDGWSPPEPVKYDYNAILSGMLSALKEIHSRYPNAKCSEVAYQNIYIHFVFENIIGSYIPAELTQTSCEEITKLINEYLVSIDGRESLSKHADCIQLEKRSWDVRFPVRVHVIETAPDFSPFEVRLLPSEEGYPYNYFFEAVNVHAYSSAQAINHTQSKMMLAIACLDYFERYPIHFEFSERVFFKYSDAPRWNERFEATYKPFLNDTNKEKSHFLCRIAQLMKDKRPIAFRILQAIKMRMAASKELDPEIKYAFFWESMRHMSISEAAIPDTFAKYYFMHHIETVRIKENPQERSEAIRRLLIARKQHLRQLMEIREYRVLYHPSANDHFHRTILESIESLKQYSMQAIQLCLHLATIRENDKLLFSDISDILYYIDSEIDKMTPRNIGS